jgi:hypothetical protein
MNLFNRIFGFILNLNGFVIILISVLLGFFSNYLFGFGILFLGFLVLVTTPELNIRIGESDWTFGIPVFPGKGVIRFAFGLTVMSAIVFAVFGQDALQPYKNSFRLAKLQNATQQSIKLIKAGRVYYEKFEDWGSISGTKGIFLGEEKKTKGGELVLRFRLQGSESDRYNGPVVWVPILMIGKKSSPQNPQTSAVQKSSRSKLKKQSGVIELTPEEIWARNEHRAYPGQMLITLPEYKAYSRVVLLEDFVIETNNPQNVTVVAFSGKRGFIGEGQVVRVPAGTEFRFGGGEPMISVVSRGEQKFSSLKLKEVK